MASIHKRDTTRGARYDVRYRTPEGTPRKRTFRTKAEARTFAATVEADMARGDWLDDNQGRLTFAEWADDWMATRSHVKPKTLAGYRSVLDAQLLPRLADRPLVTIDHKAVLALVSQMSADGAKPGTVRNAKTVLSSIFGLAVLSDAIRSNPCHGVKIAQGRREEMHFLSPAEVLDLAATIDSAPEAGYGLLVRLTAYTGLRAGELAALRVESFDAMLSRLRVTESASEVHGELLFGEPKTYEHRTVSVPATLADELTHRVAGRSPRDLIFTAVEGGPLRQSNFYRRHFKPAVVAAGLPEGVRFHDLRHTAAALLIAQGAHPRAIMERLGHSSVTVSLDRYGHLFPELDEALTTALDEQYRAAKPTPNASVSIL